MGLVMNEVKDTNSHMPRVVENQSKHKLLPLRHERWLFLLIFIIEKVCSHMHYVVNKDSALFDKKIVIKCWNLKYYIYVYQKDIWKMKDT